MPITYQRAPAMHAHMKTPSTKIAPCSAPSKSQRDSRVVIASSLIGINGFRPYGSHRDRNLQRVGRVREVERHRTSDAVGDANAALGLDLYPNAHFTHLAVVHG